MKDPIYLNAKEVGALVRIPLPQVYSLPEKLPRGVVARIGRRWRFNREALLEWLANGGSVSA